MATIETQGTTLALGNGASPEVFTNIGNIVTLTGPDGQTQQIDITNLSSTAREFRLALQDFGTINFEMHYEDSVVQNNVRTEFTGRTTSNYRITMSDSPASTITFAALCQGFSYSFNIDDVVRVNVTLKVSGSPTFA